MRGERTNIKLFDQDTYMSIFFGSSVGVQVVLRKDVDERRTEEITLPEVPYPRVHENRFLFFKLCLRPEFSLGFLIFFCLLHSYFHN